MMMFLLAIIALVLAFLVLFPNKKHELVVWMPDFKYENNIGVTARGCYILGWRSIIGNSWGVGKITGSNRMKNITRYAQGIPLNAIREADTAMIESGDYDIILFDTKSTWDRMEHQSTELNDVRIARQTILVFGNEDVSFDELLPFIDAAGIKYRCVHIEQVQNGANDRGGTYSLSVSCAIAYVMGHLKAKC